MAEYIEREALMRQIKEIHCAECNSYHGVRCRACWVDDTLDYIDSEPAADVAPVRHGRWETIDASTWRWSHDGAKPVHRVKYRHNECGRVVQRKEPYCPNCGAKMDLEC